MERENPSVVAGGAAPVPSPGLHLRSPLGATILPTGSGSDERPRKIHKSMPSLVQVPRHAAEAAAVAAFSNNDAPALVDATHKRADMATGSAAAAAVGAFSNDDAAERVDDATEYADKRADDMATDAAAAAQIISASAANDGTSDYRSGGMIVTEEIVRAAVDRALRESAAIEAAFIGAGADAWLVEYIVRAARVVFITPTDIANLWSADRRGREPEIGRMEEALWDDLRARTDALLGRAELDGDGVDLGDPPKLAQSRLHDESRRLQALEPIWSYQLPLSLERYFSLVVAAQTRVRNIIKDPRCTISGCVLLLAEDHLSSTPEAKLVRELHTKWIGRAAAISVHTRLLAAIFSHPKTTTKATSVLSPLPATTDGLAAAKATSVLSHLPDGSAAAKATSLVSPLPASTAGSSAATFLVSAVPGSSAAEATSVLCALPAAAAAAAGSAGSAVLAAGGFAAPREPLPLATVAVAAKKGAAKKYADYWDQFTGNGMRLHGISGGRKRSPDEAKLVESVQTILMQHLTTLSLVAIVGEYVMTVLRHRDHYERSEAILGVHTARVALRDAISRCCESGRASAMVKHIERRQRAHADHVDQAFLLRANVSRAIHASRQVVARGSERLLGRVAAQCLCDLRETEVRLPLPIAPVPPGGECQICGHSLEVIIIHPPPSTTPANPRLHPLSISTHPHCSPMPIVWPNIVCYHRGVCVASRAGHGSHRL